MNTAAHNCGVGVDLVEIKRAENFARAGKSFLKRFLSPSEYNIYTKAKNKTLAFGLIFASKEAASKALGLSIQTPHGFSKYCVGLQNNQLYCQFLGDERYKKVKLAIWPFSIPEHIGVVAFPSKASIF